MPTLTIPNPESEFAKCSHCGASAKIAPLWFQKFTEWLRKTNQDSLSTNGKLTVAATSDTNLRFSYIGSDGVTRVADLTLA